MTSPLGEGFQKERGFQTRIKNENMKIKKKTLMWVVIGVLFLAVLYMTFKPANIASANTGEIDTTGWTANEKMNYEMHGLIPARSQGSAPSTSAGSGMVGGC